jgi:O-antigen/teichoic acid export membrane protein
MFLSSSASLYIRERTLAIKDSDLQHVAKDDVGPYARRGAAWSVVQVVFRNVASIGSTAVLARLLTPDDYGLMGMVATLTALLLVFSDMGLSWATVQRREISAAQVSNLFWINLIAGGLLWLLCALAAPYLAKFYGRFELAAITVALGASFLIGGLAVQPFALMQRRMQFRDIAKIEMTAVAVAAIAAIIAASGGLGYWSLVVQALVVQAVRVALVLPRSGIRIKRPQFGAGTRQMVSFGGLLTLNALLAYVAWNLDGVFIGRQWGTTELGYYNRAYFLMVLPTWVAIGILGNLMMPSLSAFQNDVLRFGNAYRRAVRLVAFIGSPIAVGLALTASEAVRLVYGERWMPVVPMLVWLSVAAITQPVYCTHNWLFVASGRAKHYFIVTLVNAVVLTLTFAWSVRGGATTVAMAYGVVMGCFLIWPALWLGHRSAGLRLRDTAYVLAPVAAAVLAMGVAVLLVGHIAEHLSLPRANVFVLKVFTGVGVYTMMSARLLRSMLRSDLIPMLPDGLGAICARWIR